MIRRRRQKREIPFSFDSFLDVVANVVGIIIRLILIVWVGARSYSSVKSMVIPESSQGTTALAALPKDPLQDEIALHRSELADLQARLLEQLRLLKQTQSGRENIEGQLAALTDRERDLNDEINRLDHAAAGSAKGWQEADFTLAGLHERREKLLTEIKAFEKLPPLKKVLHYRTPVSRTVHADEFFFECHEGRVTFLDISSLVAEMRNSAEEKIQEQKNSGHIEGATIAAGAFRMRYTLDRNRSALETALNTGSGDGGIHFTQGLIEPVTMFRGESQTEALRAGSQFRQVVDVLDPQLAVVTFWIYPDSFGLYRDLRDYLYGRELEVAGRPLPQGYPIVLSNKGTLSRGQ